MIINKNKKNNLNYSFFLPFLLDYLGLNTQNETDPVILVSTHILILAIIILFCFINISGYIIFIYIIKETNLIEKYPKFKKIIKYYESTNKIFLLFEIILVLILLLGIIIINMIVLGFI